MELTSKQIDIDTLPDTERTKARRCVHVEVRNVEQAFYLYRTTELCLERDEPIPAIEYQGEHWWVTGVEIKGTVAVLRLHEAIELRFTADVFTPGGKQ